MLLVCLGEKPMDVRVLVLLFFALFEQAEPLEMQKPLSNMTRLNTSDGTPSTDNAMI
jgi:hypothetical protein